MGTWPNWKGYLAAFFGIWSFLYFCNTNALIRWFSFGFLSVFIADLILKLRNEYFTEKLFISKTEEKIVVITGCDTGFGNMLAQRLGNMGFTVFAGCLFPDQGGAEKLSQNKKIKILKLDVTSDEDICRAAAAVKEETLKSGLKLWSVVNNAGISISGEIDFLKMEDFRRIMDVNAFGAVAVTKAFLPLLREAGQGRVVNVASLAGRISGYGFTPYCMSKRAMVAFSDGLRLEMKKWNITVHTVEPAAYRTSILDEDSLKAQNAKVWNEATQEAQEAYGKKFYKERTQASLSDIKMQARGEDKLREVVDDLVHAVSCEAPKTQYIPSLPIKILARVLHFAPFDALDWLATRHLKGIAPLKAPAHVK